MSPGKPVDMVANSWPTQAYHMAHNYPVNLLIGLQTVITDNTLFTVFE